MTTRLWAAVLLAILARPVGQADVPGYRFSRAIDVPQAGWVRVPFEPEIRGQLAAGVDDLRLFDPDGRPVYFRESAPASAAPPATAEIVSVDEAADGWQLTFDLGPAPPTHEGLHLDIADHGLIPGTRLEGSDDRAAWRLLTSAELFRLGEGAGLQRTSLSYGPTSVRFLRLWWPGAAGLPQVRQVGVTVRPPERPSREVSVRVERLGAQVMGSVADDLSGSDRFTPHPPAPSPQRGEGEQRVGRLGDGNPRDYVGEYRLSLPGPASVTQLRLQLAGTGAVGYRLFTATRDEWLVQSEGRLPRTADPLIAAIPLFGAGVDASPLRLVLYGQSAGDVELATTWADIEPEWLLFYAEAAGRYTLGYALASSMSPASRPPSLPPTPPLERVPEIAAGPEVEHPLRPLPASVTAPGAHVDPAAFAAAWQVVTPGADAPAAGDLVQLQLPMGAIATARADLGDVRLLVGKAQLPYVWQPVDEPELYVDRPVMVPAPGPARMSVLAVDFMSTRQSLNALELTAPAAPFKRPLSLVYVESPSAGTAQPAEYHAGGASWTCAGEDLLPCRTVLRLDRNPARHLEIRLDDGDNASLPLVGVRVWRAAPPALRFPWPEAGEVRLVSGYPALRPPRYDLAAIREDVLRRPAVTAQLKPIPPAQPTPLPEPRYLLLGALALAAVVLVVVLARVLREEGPTAG